MTASFDLWLEYLIRFSHLVAGIAWIGSSFYFIWLDSSFEVPKVPRRNVEGELYMVHGGFYYQVEKRKIYPGELPETLHWFKWEATLTWITGILLFAVVYYSRGASLLAGSDSGFSATQNILTSVSLVIAGWFIYDGIWKYISKKSVAIMASAILLFVFVLINSQIFSGRGAFIQTGAMLGSMMLLNVWIRILPGQRKMLADAQAGKIPDYSFSVKAKTRSVHNTYFTFPVLFIMISNHYPMLYNHPQKWLLLIILMISGALVRHAMVTKNKIERWVILPALLGLFSLIYLTAVPAQSISRNNIEGPMNFEQLKPVLEARCWACHSTHPTDELYPTAPRGLIFETEAQVQAMLPQIETQVVVAKTMPLANRTNMSEQERAIVARYLQTHSKK